VKLLKKIIFALALAGFAPAKLFACAACYGGNIDAPITNGMNWGIFTLMAVIGTVLAVFLTFLIHIIRKSEALNAETEAKAHPPEALKI
jgi:uncharacterized membrane protein